MYLSSFRLGNETQKLVEMVGNNKRTAVISNALDFSDDIERKNAGTQREIDDLNNLGFQAEELDLRKFFGKEEKLINELEKFGLIWVRGGNTFILRRAFKESCFDKWLIKNKENPNFVYAGYSAGVCILAPTLKGLETVDDPYTVTGEYKKEIIWEGLGLINYCVAPHYHSDHPESEAVNKTVEYYIENKMLFVALHDGEVIVLK
jgi:dipeptidase E